MGGCRQCLVVCFSFKLCGLWNEGILKNYFPFILLTLYLTVYMLGYTSKVLPNKLTSAIEWSCQQNFFEGFHTLANLMIPDQLVLSIWFYYLLNFVVYIVRCFTPLCFWSEMMLPLGFESVLRCQVLQSSLWLLK